MYDTSQNNIQGWMSTNELEWLYEQAQEREFIVEVGSWKGRSSHALASGCKGTLYCVDHFKGSPDELQHAHKEATEIDIFPIFIENMKQFDNVRVCKMGSAEAVHEFPDGYLDMVFIDGTHTTEAVLNDVRLWLPKLKEGGLMCGHDAGYDTVKRALNQCGRQWEVAVNQIWRFV